MARTADLVAVFRDCRRRGDARLLAACTLAASYRIGPSPTIRFVGHAFAVQGLLAKKSPGGGRQGGGGGEPR